MCEGITEKVRCVSEEKVKYNSDRKDHSSYPLEIKKIQRKGRSGKYVNTWSGERRPYPAKNCSTVGYFCQPK